MNKVLVGAALGLAVAVWSQPGLAKTSHKHYRPAPERVASQDGRQNDKEETCGDPIGTAASPITAVTAAGVPAPAAGNEPAGDLIWVVAESLGPKHPDWPPGAH